MLEGVRFLARALPHLPRFARYRADSTASFADLLESRAARHPERPFVEFEGRRTTYGDMEAASNRVARWAHATGLRRGDAVALLMENRPEYLATWMGLAKLGVVTALVNTNLTGRALRHALAVSGASHLVLGSECADRYATTADDLERCLRVFVDRDPAAPETGAEAAWGPDLQGELAGQPAEPPPAAWREGLRSRDDLFYIYTSGTTGPPKAARFSHLRFLAGADLAAWAQGLRSDDVHYGVLPLYHTAGGVMQLSSVLFAGATLALRRRFSASEFWDDVRKHEATAFQYIGELCRYLVARPEQPGERDHRLRLAIGNGLRADVWETFQRRFGIPRIFEFYGATEGNVGFMNFENEVGSVGRFPSRLLARVMSNARLIRYDVETGTHPRGPDGFCIECEAGEAGELLGRIPPRDVRATGRFEGYTSEEATERKVLRDVFRPGDAWFRTGDLLRRDARGFHYFVDRIGDTYRWKGENVSTQEVAELLSELPELDLVNVYGVEVPGHEGRAGMLAFVAARGAEFDPAAFGDFVARRLPAYAAPVFVRRLAEAEVTGTFKLRKVTLQAEGFDPARVADPLWWRDPATGRYVPLTPEAFRAIRDGAVRL